MPSRPSRSLWLVGVVFILAAGITHAALDHVDEEGAGLRLLALTDPISESMVSPQSAYVSFDLFPVCLSAEGEVRITAVEPVATRGTIEITGFGTVTYAQVGSRPSIVTARIRDTAYLQGSKTVRAQCLEAKPNDTELVSRSTFRDGTTKPSSTVSRFTTWTDRAKRW